MKNSIVNIPFFKLFYNYFSNLTYKVKSKKLLIGHLNEIRQAKFGGFNSLGDRVSLKYVTLGTYSYVSYDTEIRHTVIGKFCSIGPRCQIGLGIHPVNEFLSTHPLFYSDNPPISLRFVERSRFQEIKSIQIGNDVWIGAGAIILDGITIGDGAIVGAGAVVTKDIAPFSIVKGIPAKHSGYKFDVEKINGIRKDPWWDKDLEWIKKHIQSATNKG